MSETEYNATFAKIIRRVSQIHIARQEYSPTPERKAIERLAKQLDELISALDADSIATWGIEAECDREEEGSYKHAVNCMRELSASARRAIADLPDPRTKFALPFAATAVLHLRSRHGFPRPTLYGNGDLKNGNKGLNSGMSDEVSELNRVCQAAGIHLSPERLRGALTDALKAFDPFYFPSGMEELFG